MNKNFGVAGSIIANNLIDADEDPWNTGRVVDRDSKKKTAEQLQKNYNTVDMRTKKANKDARDSESN